MTARLTAAAALTAAVALTPAAAEAHVTLQPKQAAAGGYTVEYVRVPNEKDDAATTKVEVQMPPGFESASYQPTPGWSVTLQRRGDEVGRITWTAKDEASAIQPGQFRDFPLSVKIPGKAGDVLTFKALQTYSDGEVVRWIGAQDADEPAPVVRVTAAQEDDHGASAKPASAAVQPASATSDDDDSDGNGLAIAALVLAAAALGVGGAGLARTRKAAG